MNKDDHLIECKYDKIFSNAAMHWILRPLDRRHTFFQSVHRLLKPDGSFVFEMGGKGNVAEIHTAVIAALVMHGIDLGSARDSMAWFFPSKEWMDSALVNAGFVVEKMEIEYRLLSLRKRHGMVVVGWRDGSG